MRALTTLWKFSRPHTVVGSAISIITLYIILSHNNRIENLPLLIIALIAGISINIFIVGINQIADVSIDRINKPWLPIPSGALNPRQAKKIILTALSLSALLALSLTPYFFVTILLSAFLGWAYSMPPFHLKKHHLSAALAISIVRGILVNVGGFIVFTDATNSDMSMPQNVKLLTCFITVFSLVIAWFKDLPDVKGDAQYNIKTLAVTYSTKVAFIVGNVLLVITYLLTICIEYYNVQLVPFPNSGTKILLWGHVVLLVFFLLNSFSVKLDEANSVQKFYKRFWLFFFMEYLLFLFAAL
jgi:homogentisate phytyltransferase / homogentisate geranylgeranyltransferase